MDRFTTHRGSVAPLVRDSIDTDEIMPKQFLKRIERAGFGEFVFNDWRFDQNGRKIEEFVLNDPRYENASVLLSGNNFGCGSSREHAHWGLFEYGFKVIIALSFADIFYNNCFKTGILPIVVDPLSLHYFRKKSETTFCYYVSVNLKEQTISDEYGHENLFEIDPFRKHCLIEGLDDIGLTELPDEDIGKYEASRRI